MLEEEWKLSLNKRAAKTISSRSQRTGFYCFITWWFWLNEEVKDLLYLFLQLSFILSIVLVCMGDLHSASKEMHHRFIGFPINKGSRSSDRDLVTQIWIILAGLVYFINGFSKKWCKITFLLSYATVSIVIWFFTQPVLMEVLREILSLWRKKSMRCCM